MTTPQGWSSSRVTPRVFLPYFKHFGSQVRKIADTFVASWELPSDETWFYIRGDCIKMTPKSYQSTPYRITWIWSLQKRVIRRWTASRCLRTEGFAGNPFMPYRKRGIQYAYFWVPSFRFSGAGTNRGCSETRFFANCSRLLTNTLGSLLPVLSELELVLFTRKVY